MPLPAEFIEAVCKDAEHWHPNICQFCLEFHSENHMVRDIHKLGRIKTILATPDAVGMICCETCWNTVWNHAQNMGIITNPLLRAQTLGLLQTSEPK